MSRLLLSKEHGLNPSLLCCPLCGADTGVALCGRLSVVRPEYLRRVLDAGSAEEAVRMRAAHVDVAVYEALGLGAQPHDEVKP